MLKGCCIGGTFKNKLIPKTNPTTTRHTQYYTNTYNILFVTLIRFPIQSTMSQVKYNPQSIMHHQLLYAYDLIASPCGV